MTGRATKTDNIWSIFSHIDGLELKSLLKQRSQILNKDQRRTFTALDEVTYRGVNPESHNLVTGTISYLGEGKWQDQYGECKKRTQGVSLIIADTSSSYDSMTEFVKAVEEGGNIHLKPLNSRNFRKEH
jgi:hypothetical protein